MPFPLEFNIQSSKRAAVGRKDGSTTSAPNGTNFKVLLSASSGG